MGKQIKNTILLILYITLGLTLLIGGLWIYTDYESKENVEKLQSNKRARQIVTEEPGTEEHREISIEELYDDAEQTSAHVTEEPKEILPHLKDLYDRNPDLAGWLNIPDTEINYPVMFRSGDNDYYLHHNYYGEDDNNGLLVLDKRCDPSGNGINALIHGHNMKSGAMFGDLDRYLSPQFYKEHSRIIFSSLYETGEYEIFAVFRSSVYNETTDDFQFYNYINIENETDFNDYVSNAIQQSVYSTGIQPVWGDRLVTLSTCEYTKENGRLVVVGRQIR